MPRTISQREIKRLIQLRHKDPKTRRKLRRLVGHLGGNYQRQIDALSPRTEEDSDDHEP
jgi:hypothetical protein